MQGRLSYSERIAASQRREFIKQCERRAKRRQERIDHVAVSLVVAMVLIIITGRMFGWW